MLDLPCSFLLYVLLSILCVVWTLLFLLVYITDLYLLCTLPPSGNPVAVNKYRIVFLIYFRNSHSLYYRNSSIIGEYIENWTLNIASPRDVYVPTDITRLFDVPRIRRMWCEDNDVLGPAAIMKNHYGISRELLEGVMTNFNQESQNRSWGSRLRNSSSHNNRSFIFIWNTWEIKKLVYYNFLTEQTHYLVTEVRYGVGLRRNEMIVHYLGALSYLMVSLYMSVWVKL